MIVALVRHGVTAWNEAGRMQGRADVPLSARGRAQVRRWRLPPALASARIATSPLARASETAALLGAAQPEIVDALTEMDWGAWEGATLAELRSQHAVAFEASAARGLDFRAPGGESPREVRARVAAWLVSIAREADPRVAITHKGVVRAALTLATDWNMLGKPPVRLADDVVHVCDVREDGAIRSVRWNVPLIEGTVVPRRPGAAPGDPML